jgi:hypothetical protein
VIPTSTPSGEGEQEGRNENEHHQNNDDGVRGAYLKKVPMKIMVRVIERQQSR